MRYEIRAMSLAELLDTAFQLLRDRFLLLVGLAALAHVPLAILAGPLLSDPMSEEGLGEDVLLALVAAGAIYLLLLVTIYPLVTAALTRAVGDLLLGRPVGAAGSLRAGLGRLLPLLVTTFTYSVLASVAAVAVFGGLAGVFVALGGSFDAAPSGLLVFGAFAAVVATAFLFAVYLGTPFVLLGPVVVLEETAFVDAIGRSFDLLGGQRLRVLGIFVVAGILVAIPVGGLSLIGAAWPWIGAVVTGLGQAIGFAFTSAAGVVLYYDLRCRKEGFDLEHLTSQVEARVPQPGASGSGDPGSRAPGSGRT